MQPNNDEKAKVYFHVHNKCTATCLSLFIIMTVIIHYHYHDVTKHI